MLELNTNKSISKKLKPNKCLIVSTLLHLFVVLMFLCPHIFFKQERKFISNNIISVQVLVQEKTQKKKEKKDDLKKEDKLSLLPKEKYEPKKEIATNNSHIKESIVANQYVANIKYNILKSSEPSYPARAKRLSLAQQIIIKTRLLVDKQGNIEKIEFLESNIDKSIEKFFHKEILSSIDTWQFSKVTVDDKPVKIYFYKNFIFQNL